MTELSNILFYHTYKIKRRGNGKKLKWTIAKTKSTQLLEQRISEIKKRAKSINQKL